jgi:erythromycin esterase
MPIRCTCVFLLLVGLNVASGCGSSTKPEEPESDLLTDEEMLTEEDPNAPDENPAWSEWIASNNIPIRSLTSTESSDLEALVPHLEGARVVQFGESGHGMSQFNSVKVRLIRFLHERLDFDVIAFESGLFDCRYAEGGADTLTAEEMMRSSIFPVWHCHEVMPLFVYLKDTRAGGDPLTLAGFDIQFSSPTSREHRPAFFKAIVGEFNAEYADEIFELDGEFTQNFNQQRYIRDNRWTLINEYGALADSLAAHKDEFVADPLDVMVAERTARFTGTYVNMLFYFNVGNYALANELRDWWMADNVQFLLDQFYPGKKVMIWAHNVHICHDYEAFSIGDFINMGKHLHEARGEEIYTVGLYMYRGSAATNSRQTYDVTPAKPGSIESIFYRTRRKHCFADMSGQDMNEGNSWMFRRINAKTWGVSNLTLVPRDQYNAILFIDTVSPPDYLPYAATETGASFETPLWVPGDRAETPSLSEIR